MKYFIFISIHSFAIPEMLDTGYAAKTRDRRARSRSEHLGIDERTA